MRRGPGESVSQFRRRRDSAPQKDLGERLGAWVLAHHDELQLAEPDLPAEDRAADCWEPLCAVADLAGRDWPSRIHLACKVLCDQATEEDSSLGVRLLADLHGVFDDADKLATESIIDLVCAIGEASCADDRDRKHPRINPRGLAALLRLYGIKSKTVRIGGSTPAVTSATTSATLGSGISRP